MSKSQSLSEGGCACRDVRYQLNRLPLFVHCCHCTRCQRETGAAFALNLLLESTQIKLLSGELENIVVPTVSGKGQKICRCSRCHVAVWSHYAGAKDRVSFIKVGTLDEPSLYPPDIHIYTSTKLHWLELTDGKPIYPGFYQKADEWPQESQKRYRQILSNSSFSR